MNQPNPDPPCRICKTGKRVVNSLCADCAEKYPPSHAGTKRVPDGQGCTERLPTFVDDNPYEVF
jgi:hypothetical protein